MPKGETRDGARSNTIGNRCAWSRPAGLINRRQGGKRNWMISARRVAAGRESGVLVTRRVAVRQLVTAGPVGWACSGGSGAAGQPGRSGAGTIGKQQGAWRGRSSDARARAMLAAAPFAIERDSDRPSPPGGCLTVNQRNRPERLLTTVSEQRRRVPPGLTRCDSITPVGVGANGSR